ncbi:hypothetical protein C8Q80DRAFT_1194360 [Daedaleopsis nitida]|nr:hypothetical protein C8Q80DRAFT_1194360 [Daedaleopsis nitida]
MTTNLYEILGLTKDATPEEVRKAYRKRALQTHPDRLPQDVSPADKKAAEEQFRLVNNAYEILNDANNRQLYDKHGVWPPPAEQPTYSPSTRGAEDPLAFFMNNPFANDPFFSSPFGGPRRPFVFTDPFELFNSLFGDVHRGFSDDYFFPHVPSQRSPFDDPFFRTPFAASSSQMRDPFAGTIFGGSMLGGMLGGSMLPAMEDMSGTRVYRSSSTQMMGSDGQFVSRSQMTRTINGRTEVITKRIDAQGNEHVTYSSPDGERYTINGIDQPSHGSLEGPRRSGSGSSPRQPPPTIADRPANHLSEAYEPVRAFSVPVAGSSHSRAHPQAQTVPQPVVPPHHAYHERHSSRHSTRDRADVEEPRRGYTMPAPAHAPVIPEDPARLYEDPRARNEHEERAYSESRREKERERRDSKSPTLKERVSRHSHDREHREAPEGGHASYAHVNGQDRRRRASGEQHRGGWRGW